VRVIEILFSFGAVQLINAQGASGTQCIPTRVTISNCHVTGSYEIGTVLDGTWRRMLSDFARYATGHIKCDTESNGGFRSFGSQFLTDQSFQLIDSKTL
jgi:hypothetical protein